MRWQISSAGGASARCSAKGVGVGQGEGGGGGGGAGRCLLCLDVYVVGFNVFVLWAMILGVFLCIYLFIIFKNYLHVFFMTSYDFL